MPNQKNETLRQRQERTKPLIDDAIRESLDGDMRKNALDFVASVRKNKLNLSWGGVVNTWKALCKGKPICFIRVDTEHNEKNAWSASVRLHHFREYENIIIHEGLQDEIFNNLSHCNCQPSKCGHAKKDTVFGKEITRCWSVLGYGSGEPDEAMLARIEWILGLEIKARKNLLADYVY